MFRLLGNLISRYWPVWLIFWIVLVILGQWLAPDWGSATRSGEVASLPTDVPSREADRLFQQAFELEFSASNIALVFSREDGEFRDADLDFIREDLSPALTEIATADPDNNPITSVRTPTDKNIRTLLQSPDRKATLVVIELKTAIQDRRNPAVLADVEKVLDTLRSANKIPPGLEVGITGGATAGRDLDLAEAATARAIERWTIVIVVVLLILLYRAPIAAFIPLVTVFVAVEVGLSALAVLAGAGVLTLFRDIRVFITVLAYGAGVDYCVFLIARYREELCRGLPPAEALAHAVSNVGGAITASAATVIGGIGMLYFARFTKIKQAGLTIPFALIIALAATLTVAGPLLRLTGRSAFWPQPLNDCEPETASEPRKSWMPRMPDVWGRLGPILVRWPGTVWLASVAVMAPFAVIAVWHYEDQNFNPLSDLPKDASSVLGAEVVGRHFSPGALGTVTALVHNDRVDFAADDGIDLIKRLADRLTDQKDKLGIADIRSIAAPLGISESAKTALAQLRTSDREGQELVRNQARNYYVSQAEKLAGHVTRLDLTLTADPLSREAISGFDRLAQAVRDALPTDAGPMTVSFSGSTASLRDLGQVKHDDQRRVELLVSVVILVLLLIVFRRFVLSVYLVLSVLFSYLATLGLTYLVFHALSGPEFAGLDWKVPIFLFTILVAVGEDYNIFLLARVKEEQARHGPLGAIPVALARTGRVISSCGIIMAGTFASLLSGSLRAMQELGFALAVGVLLDTLVVRPILVPAFLVLLQRVFPGRVGEFMALGKWTGRPV